MNYKRMPKTAMTEVSIKSNLDQWTIENTVLVKKYFNKLNQARETKFYVIIFVGY